MLDLFLTNMQLFVSALIGGLEFVKFLISCLDSHSNGTLSLQMIHWWSSNVMLNLFKSVLMKKQTHLSWIA